MLPGETEQDALVQMRFGIIRLERDRPLRALARGVVLAKLQQHRAALGDSRNMPRLQRQQAVERRERLGELALFQECSGGDVKQVDVAGIELQALAAGRARGLELPEL